MQDDAGGGSGGSIWLTPAALAGTGPSRPTAARESCIEGGGGGGGRIAIYTPAKCVWRAGLGRGRGRACSPGQTGSVYYAGAPAAPQVVSFAPVGTFTAAVSTAEIVFNTPVNPYSVQPRVSL